MYGVNAKILPQSLFDQATVPADARGQKTNRSARSRTRCSEGTVVLRRRHNANAMPTAVLNYQMSLQEDSRRQRDEWWNANADTMLTTALNSRTSQEEHLRRLHYESLGGAECRWS